jgi:TolB-like protein
LALVSLVAALAASGTASANPAEDRRPTVAVLYFDYSGQNPEMFVLRKGLAQMLITDLAELPGIRLVERDRLEDLMAELKLTQGKQVDEATANRMGKLLGARYLVLGGYFDLMGQLRLDARVVEVETGKLVKSVGSAGKIDEFLSIQVKLSDQLEAVMTSALPEMPKRSAERRVKRPSALSTATASKYAKALDAKDRGDLKAAKAELEQVVKAEPDFHLAMLDLQKLIQ